MVGGNGVTWKSRPCHVTRPAATVSVMSTATGDEHFHGGTSATMMCHYAILGAAGEATSWFEPVTDEQCTAAHTRLMVQLAAVLAAGGLAEFRVLAGAALANAGVSPVELKEVVYQAVAYVGMARTYDYLHAVNEILAERGVELPLPPQATTTAETRFERGIVVQKKIVGDERVEAMPRCAVTSAQT